MLDLAGGAGAPGEHSSGARRALVPRTCVEIVQ
jgi:hypothetical protein